MTATPALNPAVAGLAVPPIAAVQQWARGYAGDRGPLIDLAQAVPGYPPHADLLRWLAGAAGDAASAGYGDILGEPALRAAYAEHVSELYGAPVDSGNISITAGCNQAFAAAVMAVAGAGDSVLLLDPFYFNHESLMAMLGINAERIACRAENGFVPTTADIQQAIHPGVRAVVLISPNNPTGAVYPPDLIAAVYDLCRRNDLWLLLDETYRDFLPAAEATPHGLFSRDDWGEQLIQLYSFSKSFCIPGHRLGAITAGVAVVEQIAKIMDNLQICAPRTAQIAITRALPALSEWRAANRREILARAEAFRVTMAAAPQWPIKSIGAYFAYVEHPFADESSRTVSERLTRRNGIATVPGEFFGSGQEKFLRMAFANAGCDTIREIGPRLAALD